ncbi:MAG: hypothetical protein ACUVQI_02200 [Thermochromatium sp.]
MRLSWPHQLAKALASGRPNLALELHLDTLLIWLNNPDHPRVAELERAIAQQRLTRDQARANAYRLLDQLLFAGDTPPTPVTLGFLAGTEATRAKQRYRRLMQVYHPDRHPERTAWATRRTEQINRAFAAFQRGETGATRRGSRKAEERPGATRSSIWRLPPVWIPPALRDPIAPAWVWIHDHWVALTPTQQRLMNLAVMVGVLMITVALWPKAPPKPVPKIIHHPLGIETTPEPPPSRIATTEPTPGTETPQPSLMSPTVAADEPDEAPVVAPKPNALLDLEPSVAPEATGHEPSPQRPTPMASESTPNPVPEPTTTQAATSAFLESPDRLAAPPPTAFSPGVWSWTQPTPLTARLPHAGIPSAATPAPPKPPAVPEPPLALSTTPDGSTLMSGGSPLAGDCQTAPTILSRLKRAYEAGALDALMELYSPLAKENELNTWFAIRQTYAEWFRTTSARHIDFEQIQVQPIPDSRRCALLAVFQVGYLDRQSRLVTQSGIIELLLERKNSDWLILRAHY